MLVTAVNATATAQNTGATLAAALEYLPARDAMPTQYWPTLCYDSVCVSVWDSFHPANAHNVDHLGDIRTRTVRDKRCGIHPQSLVSAPLDRGQWRTTCRAAVAAFEEARVATLERKRAARKRQVVINISTASVSYTHLTLPTNREV